MCALPAATYVDTKTIVGRQSIIVLTVATVPTNLLVDYVSHTPGLELGRYQAPGAAGPAFTPRTWEKGRAEFFKFKTKEIKKIMTILGGLSARKVGTCTAYICDPQDAAGKVAIKTDDFPCSIYLDSGDQEYSPTASPTEVTVVLESHKDGAITLSVDGDA